MAKRFSFRLEPVLKYRERIEEQMRGRFVEIQNIRHAKADELSRVQDEQRRGKESMGEAKTGLLDLSRLRLMNRYLTGLTVTERQKSGELRVIEAEAEKRRQEFVGARQQTKVMENLKDRRRDEHEYEENREQTKLFDEMAVQKVIASRKEADRLEELARLDQERMSRE